MYWMPENVWNRYKQLIHEAAREPAKQGGSKGQKGKGKKGKGKKDNGEKEMSKAQRAHQMKKNTFNVYLFKLFGNKALFFHFVRVGPKNVSISNLLEQWRKFKTTGDYHDLKRSSEPKTSYEKKRKSDRDWYRRELKAKEKSKAPRSEIERLRKQVKDANAKYEETGRPGKRSGVAAHLH